jgi:hypothetical protein
MTKAELIQESERLVRIYLDGAYIQLSTTVSKPTLEKRIEQLNSAIELKNKSRAITSSLPENHFLLEDSQLDLVAIEQAGDLWRKASSIWHSIK